MRRAIAPYGSWRSPITAEQLAAHAVGLGAIAVVGDELLWTESRPLEDGRTALVRRSAAAPSGAEDVLAPPWSVRSRVHEYGGGALTTGGGRVFFSNDGDRRLYEASLRGAEPRALTPAGPWRFADGVLDERRSRLVSVCEDHGGSGEPANFIAAISLDDALPPRVLASGRDFYAAPRLSPDGSALAWLSWSHPHMPWNETELWLAEVDSAGALVDARCIAGGSGESILQPLWSPDGVLHFVSDRAGWWNLHRCQDPFDGSTARALAPREAEFARPLWSLGQRTFAFADAATIVCTFGRGGREHLARLDVARGELSEIETPFVGFDSVHVARGRAWFIASSTTAPAALVELDLATGRHEVVRRSLDLDLDPEWISVAEPVAYRSGDRTAHAFFYPPKNPEFSAPEGERPPLRVRAHGGPTAATDPSLKLAIQYWTSRGFAVLDVDYAGSTGYGREYRDLLAGRWGVIDVEDCVNGALHVAEAGRADRARLTISGGSAGGYTVLCALAFHDAFRAGASHYGIGDLGALAADTHKFESRYTDWLVAPWPEGREIYRARSPLFHAERLSCPVIFFQGEQDRVVPPNQAEAMAQVLREKGIPTALVLFPDEAHGFRKAASIRRALTGELGFFARILGFTPADRIDPLPIENLDPA
ncbi:MAG: S9 family peptidase [Deltaproteobacteria bacterium]|nr:S9 family peptidase [Deltaproteobacteria bacterium]